MSGAQRDILIVDDDRQVREVLHQIFLGAGYNCLLANDGREGVEVFRSARPPLIVTDLKMPVMTGIELLRTLAREEPGLPVVVLTAHGTVDLAVDFTGRLRAPWTNPLRSTPPRSAPSPSTSKRAPTCASESHCVEYCKVMRT